MTCVLLIDDDDFTRATVERALKRQGHDVIAVAGGREALDRLRAERARIGVMITDVMMPDMDGLELIKQAVADWPDLRIIAMSAGSNLLGQNYLPAARVFGAHEILPKPCSGADLSAAIARAVAPQAA
jgi:CheY-like chemotaxis protein